VQRALRQVRAQIGGLGGRGGVPAVGRSRARARAREDAREEWGARHPLWRAGAVWSKELGTRCLCMVATHQRRVRPLRHSNEHVSGSEVAQVGHIFGLLTGRYGLWARNEGFYTRPILQFLFKVHCH